MMKCQSMFRSCLAAATLLALATPLASQVASVATDVRYLADDRLGGRLTGSPGADSAAAYLARRFAAVGLSPGPNGWFQDFSLAADAPAAHGTGLAGARVRNVVAMLPGADPALRNEYILVGAHYDHLGLGEAGGLMQADLAGQIHNGADDNASGSAALIEIARQLVAQPPSRTIVFLAFSGEELGVIGSTLYTRSPVVPIERTVAMVNLDMVGRLRKDRLIVYGVETATEFGPLLDSLNTTARFDLHAQGDGYGPSDHSSFYAVKLPVLHLFTDLHEDYHRPSDDADRINVDGIVRVSAFTAGVVRTLADRLARLTFVDLPKPQAAPAAGSGERAWFGSIPDMTGSPGGVRISGVTSGSPADKAGLQGGDVIIRIGEYDIPDLMAMTVALQAYKPGDTVTVHFRRDETERQVQVTLGRRGG